MSLEIVVFVFGGILLLIGIVGGGFEIKELKIPRVGWVARLLSSLAGVIFISFGMDMVLGEPSSLEPSNGYENSIGVPSRPSPVVFSIHDRLTENAISEQLTILIDGKVVGTITASEHYPNSMMKVTVPQSGKYSYTVDGSIVYYDQNTMTEYSYPCAGQGMINVEAGKKFSLGLSVSGNAAIITLFEDD